RQLGGEHREGARPHRERGPRADAGWSRTLAASSKHGDDLAAGVSGGRSLEPRGGGARMRARSCVADRKGRRGRRHGGSRRARRPPTVTPTPPPPTPTPVVRGTPTTLEIPKIGVSAPIVPVKTTPDGDLASPDSWDVVGWFVGGPRPGDPGNALITGHRDFANGPGGRPTTAVFWDLGKVNPGDQIVVKTDKGETLPFK